MSEAPKEAGKKKGKLPVLIIVAVVLFGGGFFGMKMKGGEKKEPELKLGKIVEFEEKLFNLSDMQTYLRTTLAFHLKDGYEEAKFAEKVAAVEDAVNLVIRSKSPAQVQTVAGIQSLKKELAANINKVLDDLDGHHDEADKDSKSEKKDKKDTKSDVHEESDHGWDSNTGPVLRVYFKAFAVQ